MPFNPYIVFGIVKKNGIPQVSVIVTIENLTLGGSDTRTTDNNGSYIYDDLTQLPNSYNSGNEIKVSTTETWTSFFAASIPEEKEINLYYTLYTIDALFKKLNIDNNYTIDTLIKALNIDRNYVIDILIKKLNIDETYFIDTLIKALNIDRNYVIDGILKAIINETYSIDTLIKKLNNELNLSIDVRISTVRIVTFKPTASGRQIKPTASGRQIKPTASGREQ